MKPSRGREPLLPNYQGIEVVTVVLEGGRAELEGGTSGPPTSGESKGSDPMAQPLSDLFFTLYQRSELLSYSS